MSEEKRLSSGERARLGVRVMWLKDNALGKIVAYDKDDGYVKVQFDDGRVKMLAKSRLVKKFLTAVY